MVLESDIFVLAEPHRYFDVAAFVAIIFVFLEDLEQSSLELLGLLFWGVCFGWLL